MNRARTDAQRFIVGKLTCAKMLTASGDVDRHAFGICELKLAMLALGEQFKPDIAFGSAGFGERAGVFFK